jgi:cobyrinic acid a,c-diamide synthase
MPIYAECGGLMVLTQSLTGLDGVRHPMFGLLPGHSQMRERLTMGYRQVKAIRDCLLLRQDETARGHEFHYSDWVDHGALPHAYEVAPRRGEGAWTEGYAEGNLLASYVHLHFGSLPAPARNLVQACARWSGDSSEDSNLQVRQHGVRDHPSRP